MEIDSLLSTSRWSILEILANRATSPLEISKLMNTSVAYISQQLKLLEAAGIIFKERTRATGKGQARNLYYLAREVVHFTALLKDSPLRKSIKLTEHQKIVLKIWLLTDEKFSYIFEKLFWNIEEDLKDISLILIENTLSRLNVIILSESKKLKQKIDSFSKKENSIDISLTSENNLVKFPIGKYSIIYDPQLLFKGKGKLKGGNNKSEL